jgi:hypothetical protein
MQQRQPRSAMLHFRARRKKEISYRVITQAPTTNGRLIVLGYDCDVKAYVVAKRNMMHPGSNSTVQESRLYAMTEEEMSAQGFINVTKSYRICPVCHGYPMSYSKQTTSGWSDWEQKSLNIYVYTREWETKTEEIGTTCRRCKGDAWVKVD